MPQYIKQIPNAIPPAFCAALIAKFDNDKAVQVDPQPEYSKRLYLNISQHMSWIKEVTKATQLADPYIADFFRLPEPYTAKGIAEWINDGFIVAKYAEGDVCGFHDDGQSPDEPSNGLRYLTVIFFLNDVKEGGELHFPVQGIKIKPTQGTMVLFPAQLTHPHEVLAVKDNRYVLQTWVTDVNLKVVSRDDEYS
ncbi:MAG: 2OG-Fe(II) oxygenase [Chitinophagaceae bacterium]|nr:2OG-Fe(II) oxygenase [Oligoflexus sp.]